MEIILATNNKHKLEEVNEISKNSGIIFLQPSEEFSPEETGQTFAENSYIKAFEAAKLTNKISLADDSGLCVEALNGEPGIHSARYESTQEKRIQKLIQELSPHTNKSAKFVCCMTLVNPNGEILHQVTSECTGYIINTPKGTKGFGYDPIFVPSGYNSTLAELGEEIKNKISHRGKALKLMLEYLTNL